MYNLYDWNLNEYNILEMTDEDYMNYCKENCRREKKYGFLYLFLAIFAFMCTVYQYSHCLYASAILTAFLVGVNTVNAINSFIDSKRWKQEIMRFMKFEYDEDSFRLTKREKILNFLKEVGHINDDSDYN